MSTLPQLGTFACFILTCITVRRCRAEFSCLEKFIDSHRSVDPLDIMWWKSIKSSSRKCAPPYRIIVENANIELPRHRLYDEYDNNYRYYISMKNRSKASNKTIVIRGRFDEMSMKLVEFFEFQSKFDQYIYRQADVRLTNLILNQDYERQFTSHHHGEQKKDVVCRIRQLRSLSGLRFNLEQRDRILSLRYLETSATLNELERLTYFLCLVGFKNGTYNLQSVQNTSSSTSVQLTFPYLQFQWHYSIFLNENKDVLFFRTYIPILIIVFFAWFKVANFTKHIFSSKQTYKVTSMSGERVYIWSPGLISLNSFSIITLAMSNFMYHSWMKIFFIYGIFLCHTGLSTFTILYPTLPFLNDALTQLLDRFLKFSWAVSYVYVMCLIFAYTRFNIFFSKDRRPGDTVINIFQLFASGEIFWILSWQFAILFSCKVGRKIGFWIYLIECIVGLLFLTSVFFNFAFIFVKNYFYLLEVWLPTIVSFLAYIIGVLQTYKSMYKEYLSTVLSKLQKGVNIDNEEANIARILSFNAPRKQVKPDPSFVSPTGRTLETRGGAVVFYSSNGEIYVTSNFFHAVISLCEPLGTMKQVIFKEVSLCLVRLLPIIVVTWCIDYMATTNLDPNKDYQKFLINTALAQLYMKLFLSTHREKGYLNNNPAFDRKLKLFMRTYTEKVGVYDRENCEENCKLKWPLVALACLSCIIVLLSGWQEEILSIDYFVPMFVKLVEQLTWIFEIPAQIISHCVGILASLCMGSFIAYILVMF